MGARERRDYAGEAASEFPLTILGQGVDPRFLTPKLIAAQAEVVLGEPGENPEGVRVGLDRDALKVLVPKFQFKGWRIAEGVELTTKPSELGGRQLDVVGRTEMVRSVLGKRLSLSLDLTLGNIPAGLKLLKGSLPIPGLDRQMNRMLEEKMSEFFGDGGIRVSGIRIEGKIPDVVSATITRVAAVSAKPARQLPRAA